MSDKINEKDFVGAAWSIKENILQENSKEELLKIKESEDGESASDDSDDDGEHDENFIREGQETKEDEDDDERSVNKEESQEEEKSSSKDKIEQAFSNLVTDVKAAIVKVSEFLSKKNQQRNLARETGGMESQEKKEISTEDVWDNRSKEVDKMGDYDIADDKAVSMVWAKSAKDKAKIKKMSKKAAQDALTSGGAIGLAALGEKKLTMAEKIKLRKDRSIETGGDGLWR